MKENVKQFVVLDEITVETPDTKTFRFVPDKERGTEALLPFRAGQYVALSAEFGGSFVTRPYSLSSSPADARAGFYTLTIQTGGPAMLLAHHMHTGAKVGDRFIVSEPTGDSWHDERRDARRVVACAGGGGITPYFSMARALEAGDEDFEMKLLYGSPTWDTIILRDRLDAIRTPGFEVTHVLEREERPGVAHGVITGDMIEEAAGGEPYSLYICGVDEMYEALKKAALALGNKPVSIVREPSCAANLPGPGELCTLTLLRDGERVRIPAQTNETLLVACERAGIRVPNRCREGHCGWCLSRLVSGEIYIQPGWDKRPPEELAAHQIHPCCTYPLGDVELEIPAF